MKEFDLDNIFTDVVVTGEKEAALRKMSALFAQKNGLDEKALRNGFQAREQESTTGFGNGVAIPHAKISGLVQPIVGIVTFKQGIAWQSLDGQPVNIAIALIMPLHDPNSEHLTVLSKLARKLMDEKFIRDLQESRHNAKALYQVVMQSIEFKN
ncbi:PTS sugar transporter subunit IIA [Pediococcus siamensis]|uniref:PTS sugar transporter subunit IIA n=1 Tax=Pediococcus siamensis TaxID=381829 RepID=UPI0039A0AFC4